MAIGDTVQAGLGRMDFSAFQRAGEAQARVGEQLGRTVGGLIEQYQLNKEKREAEERTAIGNLTNFSPQDLLQLEQTNPQLSRAVKNLLDGKGSKKDVDLINAGTAPFIAAKANERNAMLQESIIAGNQFKNALNEATKENQILKSTLETEGLQLLNSLRDQQLAVAEIERQLKENRLGVDKDLLKTQLDQAQATLSSTQEEVISKRNNNSVFREQLEAQRTKDALDLEEVRSRLAINAEKLDQIRASSDVDLKTKKENLKILETERKQLEQNLINQQNLINSLSVNRTDEGLDFIQPIDIDDAFQADAAGLFYNIVGGIGGAFGADITPETTGQAQNLKMLETFLLPALASDISSRPSNFTLNVARQKIPLPSDRDDVGQRKIEQLIPDLKLRLVEAENTIASGETDKSYFQEALTQASRIRKIIPILENSLKGRSSSLSTGTTSTNVKFKIRGTR